jgi:hypothetical protein
MEEQDVHAILIFGARGSSEVHYIRIISRNHPAEFWFPAMEKRPVLFTSSIISRVLKPAGYGPSPIPTLVMTFKERLS